MTAYDLQENMSYEEFSKWLTYFESRPLGWREDLRAAYLMNVFGEKRKPDQIFPSLKALSKQEKKNPLAGSQMLKMLLNAKGGIIPDALKGQL